MRARANRRREQTALSSYFGFTRGELLALTVADYKIFRQVYEQHQKEAEKG